VFSSVASVRRCSAAILWVVKRQPPQRAVTRRRKPPKSIDEYISRCAPEARPILTRIRATLAKAVPDATETISYGIPAFKVRRIVVYFAAFSHHIGLYPPVKGNAALEKAIAPYAGQKGNLRFPIDRRVPYGLIARIAKFRAKRSR